MPPLIHFKSAVLRRFLLLLVSPLYFLIIFGIRIGKCVDLTFFDSYDVFRAVWKGRVEEAELLPCPFCGGRANPDGWRANGGASGPSCDQCGATAWSAYTWNSRVPLSSEHVRQEEQN
ncbi:hypothetical protein OFAG_02129 [Oxalobacter formigenes HOxBLS]|uniref:Uncharacterized protein n=2 Tax=Oxalobacter paraformigenes TaxID=556268 RepID=T5LUY3_9BURK|nr:Lar family restriction alleviation protein [Oxalobacter paraformigenes]EQM95298.1 hypothetical protein OFAG_02129 [Oxalobacter paraformigenes]